MKRIKIYVGKSAIRIPKSSLARKALSDIYWGLPSGICSITATKKDADGTLVKYIGRLKNGLPDLKYYGFTETLEYYFTKALEVAEKNNDHLEVTPMEEWGVEKAMGMRNYYVKPILC